MKLDLAEAERDAIEIAALAARHRRHRRAGPRPAEARHAGRRRGGRDGARPQDEPGNPPPQLHLGGDLRDRRARAGLVRRQPARLTAVAARQIPLGARMIAIAEAFDAMTTDHVYRPASSQERAMAELFGCAGTQFDPGIGPAVRGVLPGRPGRDALGGGPPLADGARPGDGQLLLGAELRLPPPDGEPAVDGLFHGRLLDNMYDAVVFIDAEGRIMLWNHGAERLTGITGGSVCGQPWHAELLELSDEKGQPIGEADCPVYTAIRCGVQSLRRLTILGRGPAAGGRRQPRHSGDRPQGRHPGGHAAVPRRLVGNLAGAALPEPARKGHQGPADPGGQPGRVRPRPRHVRRRPPAAAGPLQPADVRPRPLQAGQRHLRPPGGRRGDQEPGRRC